MGSLAEHIPHEIEALLARSAEEVDGTSADHQRTEIHGHRGGFLADILGGYLFGVDDLGFRQRPYERGFSGANWSGDH